MLHRHPGDRYRRACAALGEEVLGGPWPPLQLPASREGRPEDSKAPLLLLGAALELVDAGIPVLDLGDIVNYLLPWVYANSSPAHGSRELSGALVDSFARSRLLFRGYQMAYLCLRIVKIVRGRGEQRLLRDVASEALRCSSTFPMGTAYFGHTYWSVVSERGGRPRRGADLDRSAALGPVDARVFVSEARFSLRLRKMGVARDA